MKKYYAVKKGLKPGIYKSWDECKTQVHKFKGAIFKSFLSLSEAEEFMKDSEKENSTENTINPTYAYIDGSFNKYTKIYGYGGFIIHNDKKYIIKGSGNEPYLVEMRNVAGEILACQKTIEKAIELGIKSIDIFYDYSGIEKWATGEYKRNKEGTKKYHEFIQSIKSKIEINFRKVKGHSGNEGNDEADLIAKEAAGIKNSNEEIFYDENENDDKKNEKEINFSKIISVSDIKHIKKKEKRNNKINKITQFNNKNNNIHLLKKKLLNDNLKNFIEKEKNGD